MTLPCRLFAAKCTAAMVLLFALFAGSVTAAELPDFADLVERNASSIVEITTTNVINERDRLQNPELEELLRQFPGQDELNIEELPQMRRRGAVGSGFIVSTDGYIITNNHVVAEAAEIQVNLNDRRVFDAEVVGLDEPSDLALLKIRGENLPFVDFGDSDKLRVGDWVLAIGSPFGLEFSAAAGIVSAKGRSVPSSTEYNYMSFIQTDVAINQGNSGGPLFNLAGEVIGINSQILSSTGGSNGISFSIPSNVAVNVIDQLKDSGRVERGLLGVRIKEVDFALAQIFSMDRPRGAFVDEVQPGSPAQAGGIENNDIVLEFNDHLISESADLPFYVGQFRPESEAKVVVFRNGELVTLTVVLGSSPSNTISAVVPPKVPTRRNPLGFQVSELSQEARQVAGLKGGVRIADISDGPGQEAGLREGDVIVSLNQQDIENTRQFAAVAEQLPETGFVPIRIFREGRGTTLALEMGQ